MRMVSILAIATGFLAAVPVSAADLLPANKPIESAIDHYIEVILKQDEITPAGQADDATLVRRLTLDLIGRIPTVAEAEAYTTSKDSAKRAKLVDRLMASPAFVRHQAAQFDAMLNANPGGGRSGSLQSYLQTALGDGKSWDKIFRELMLPDDNDPKQKGAADYLRTRVTDLDRLTNDVSISFFGVNVSCAQCHDHPLVADWKQDHFYGMKSFFSRTFDASGFLAEREAGLIKFKPTKGPERQAKLMFLTGTAVDTDTLRDLTKDEQKKDKEITDAAKSSKKVPPAPKFSARAQLVEVAMKSGEAEFFSKAIVNRLWHRFLGVGLVMPLDQMHSENPPSHPELLAWLARDTASHQYDLRRLTRGIVMSQTYSRASNFSSESQPPAKYFAVGRLKPLTPMQLATSLKLATADQESWEKLKADEFEKRIEQIEGSSRGLAGNFAAPSDDFQIGVGEALLFSNGDRIAKEVLADGGVLAKVKTLKDPKETVTMLFKAAFNRSPTAAEMDALTAYIARRTDRTAEAHRQILWAMLSSAEFRFNY